MPFKYSTLALLFATLVVVSACACVTTDEANKNILRPSIVSIVDDICNARGTGFIAEINGDRYIVSAKHIFLARIDPGPSIEEAILFLLTGEKPEEKTGDIRILDIDGNEHIIHIISYSDELDVYNNPECDWIILSCPPEMNYLPALTLSTELPLYGENVYWAGYPDTNSGTIVTECSIGDVISDGSQVRLDSPTGPGASGSPLVDPDKGVVGIVTQRTSGNGYGIALNIPFVYDYMMKELNADLSASF